MQTRETEMLREKLEKANAALTDRYLQIAEAGDLAQAVLAVNGVMNTAQAAAQQYLDNIAAMKRETEVTCIRIINEAKEEAERIRSAAMLGKDVSDTAAAKERSETTERLSEDTTTQAGENK